MMTSLAGRRVLLVEDDYHLAIETARALSLAGAEVVGPFANEQDAVSALNSDKPQCAVIDINLGQGPRFDLANALFERGMPFLFFTGYDRETIPLRFSGIVRIQKPSNPEQIVDFVGHLKERGRYANGGGLLASDQANLSNRLLKQLSPEDFDLLASRLEPVGRSHGEFSLHSHQVIRDVYFLESGVMSIVARSRDGLSAEAGIIGREGFVHPAVILAVDRVPDDIQMQVAGFGYRIESDFLYGAAEKRPKLRRLLLHFMQTYNVQVTSTALANAVHHVEERLARWLLMVHDRSDTDDLAVTHEFLSLMLSVRRPTVTNALHILEGKHLIENARGNILITNRPAMERFAADAYGVPEAEYRRLLGPI